MSPVDTVSASLGSLLADAPAPASVQPPPPSAAGEALPTLIEALGQRVQFGQGTGPLWGFGAVAVILVALVVAFSSGSCSALLSRIGASSPRAMPSALPSSIASSPRVPKTTENVAQTSASSGAASDEAALSAIEARPAADRSVADVMALAAAQAGAKRRALDELGARARSDEAFLAGGELGAKLRPALGDADTARDALRVMAELPGSRGPDWLYFVWTSRRKGDPTAELAESLLRTKEVRARASPELGVALDLRWVESCEDAKPIVERAVEQGDRRAGAALGRFAQKTGCGEKKRDDCWACLRESDALKNASKAVARRAPARL